MVPRKTRMNSEKSTRVMVEGPRIRLSNKLISSKGHTIFQITINMKSFSSTSNGTFDAVFELFSLSFLILESSCPRKKDT